jgi:hypothetical protein
VLWEMLTGRRPFEDQILPQGIEATVRDMTQRRRRGVQQAALATLPSDCPLGLKEILLKCLASDEKQRFANAGQLARALELCLDRDVRDLLYPPPDHWRARAARWPLGRALLAVTPTTWRRAAAIWPLTVVLLAGLLPNALMSELNIHYNKHAIVKMFQAKDLEALFQNTQLLVVNLIAYGLGIGAMIWLLWPLKSALKQVRGGDVLAPDQWRRIARRCLRFGEYCGWISLSLWIVTSFAFPAWMQLAHPGSVIAAREYAHFITSQLFCGLIAASLTYFFVTYVAVRSFFPRLLPPDVHDERAAAALTAAIPPVKRYHRILWFTSILALTTPMLLSLLLSEAITSDSAVTLAFVVLGAIGMLGGLLCESLMRMIHCDLAALRVAVSPSRDEIRRDPEAQALSASTRRKSG